MRILHTSDWHLGRTLHGVDLMDAQRAFHDALVDLAVDRAADVVVVAGDVYDRAVPPVEAVTALNDVLNRLAEVATVVITPGNHDSAVRLGFARGLLRSGIHLLTDLAGIARPVPVPDDHGQVLFFGLPYLEPDVVRHALSDDEEPLARSHEAVVSAAMARVRTHLAARPEARGVVLSHAFVTGGEGSDSERDIRVGGVDQVPSGAYRGVDYVALGHLHGCQHIASPAPDERGRTPQLWYSGSPLAFSFSERNHRKGVLQVDLDADGRVAVERIAAPVPRPLTRLTGSLEELLAEAGTHADDFVHAVVTDPRRPEHLHERLRAAFPHLLLLDHRPEGGAQDADRLPVVDRTRDPLEVVGDFVEHMTAREPTGAERDVLQSAYEAVRRQERSA